MFDLHSLVMKMVQHCRCWLLV